MSDSVRPHRWQPTRFPCPWDSPGKNTGVGCHFLLQCMKVKSESEVTQSCLTPSDPVDCSLPGSSVHGIFQARVLEWGTIAFSAQLMRELQFMFILQWEAKWGLFLFACSWRRWMSPIIWAEEILKLLTSMAKSSMLSVERSWFLSCGHSVFHRWFSVVALSCILFGVHPLLWVLPGLSPHSLLHYLKHRKLWTNVCWMNKWASRG